LQQLTFSGASISGNLGLSYKCIIFVQTKNLMLYFGAFTGNSGAATVRQALFLLVCCYFI
jgi:hypothetical protein